MDASAELVRNLEERFRSLSALLYDTSVDPARVDAELKPLLHQDVRFTDPFQEASGIKKYRLGAAGFHSMFRFHLDIEQVGVQLSPDLTSGRAIVDGIMQLQPLGDFFTYPLRTILVYDFDLDDANAQSPRFSIRAHEEMWSLGDMLAAVPALGWLYRRLFRPTFAVGFLAASWLTGRKSIA